MRVLIFILAMTFAFPALACRCVAPTLGEGEKSYDDADVVIKGTIIDVSGGWARARPLIKIKPTSVIKGDNIPDIMTADYNNNTATCGNSYEIDKDYTIALYDTRTLTLTDDNTRGYGFRVMISCHQYQVQNYIKEKESKK